MASPTTPRPMRADARRNYERLVEVARQVFAELGPEAPLDDIARRAGVGPGTLYRHFPNREALIAAVYRADIENLARQAHELAERYEPGEALARWLRVHVDFGVRKRALAGALKAAMDRDSEVFAACKVELNAAAEMLVWAAQQAGAVRWDIEPRDVLLMAHGIGVASEKTPETADRLLQVMLDGLRGS
ncbi:MULTISPECIES: TetR/AcrR family transcriptional regulator [Amycolatopsis]|uniref:DNA-binding transcriptional regulator, AcrR family n=2 Tax=Amycolatopsis TaxID=1813 RepID=A0A1I4A4L9_9PSEU|nr:TetR/AcrR family transcriptional regulator [Amycolatopsis sacchari]SFK51047.1 DNA-binding transcriptional regulator, AcrR family [Amycolatopsis sacchari]